MRTGQADVVLAGGADALCRFVQRGFNVLRSLTRDAVRPFDRRRTGLLLGEGAALVVLEAGAAGWRAPTLHPWASRCLKPRWSGGPTING